jgi:hypothetical protein
MGITGINWDKSAQLGINQQTNDPTRPLGSAPKWFAEPDSEDDLMGDLRPETGG